MINQKTLPSYYRKAYVVKNPRLSKEFAIMHSPDGDYKLVSFEGPTVQMVDLDGSKLEETLATWKIKGWTITKL